MVSPALTLSPSRNRISRIRPLVLGEMAESSPSIRPLNTTMLSGTLVLANVTRQITIPRAAVNVISNQSRARPRDADDEDAGVPLLIAVWVARQPPKRLVANLHSR